MLKTYLLPELSYDYGALEPHISGKIMELHHAKHHAAYVQNANAALAKLEESRGTGDYGAIAALERALAFNLSGHVLHSIFWRNLSPQGGGKPTGEFLLAIDKDFGAFDAMKQQLIAAAGTVMGSGWGALVWEPMARKLLITQIYDHQSSVAQGGVPLMVLDAWEHAYYLQYQNRKAEYLEAIWNVWDWDDIAARLRAARGLDLLAPETAR